MGYSAGSSDCIMSFSRWQKLIAARIEKVVRPAVWAGLRVAVAWLKKGLLMGSPPICRICLEKPISRRGGPSQNTARNAAHIPCAANFGLSLQRPPKTAARTGSQPCGAGLAPSRRLSVRRCWHHTRRTGRSRQPVERVGQVELSRHVLDRHARGEIDHRVSRASHPDPVPQPRADPWCGCRHTPLSPARNRSTGRPESCSAP